MTRRGFQGERPPEATTIGRHPEVVRKESWLSEYKILLETYHRDPQARKDETLGRRLQELRKLLGDEYIQANVQRSEVDGYIFPF